mmetsp:Transcript_17857/g.36938  ORF Transcript_17857/g.36938 Transcript_17857/m.36938 type:complete len:219 (+) Transcript_17857:178-834(+)
MGASLDATSEKNINVRRHNETDPEGLAPNIELDTNHSGRMRLPATSLARYCPGGRCLFWKCSFRETLLTMVCIFLAVVATSLTVKGRAEPRRKDPLSVDAIWSKVGESHEDHHHWSVNYTHYDVEHTAPIAVMSCKVGGVLGTVLVPFNSSSFYYNGTLLSSEGLCRKKKGLIELRCDAGAAQGTLCSASPPPEGTCLHEEFLRLKAQGFYEDVCDRV